VTGWWEPQGGPARRQSRSRSGTPRPGQGAGGRRRARDAQAGDRASQDKGYEVLEAADGEEALARLPEYQPHIVLLDLMMQGIGGMETLRRLKAMQPEVCVIMVTAIEEIESAQTALGLGASDYVTKPFSLQYLDSVLEVHLLMDRINPDSK
jgi:DNA-binding response OmpR family regulator